MFPVAVISGNGFGHGVVWTVWDNTYIMFWFKEMSYVCGQLVQLAFALTLYNTAYITHGGKVRIMRKYHWTGADKPIYFDREGFSCFQ